MNMDNTCGTQVGNFVQTYPNTTTTGDSVTSSTISIQTTPYTWAYPYPYIYSWPERYDDSVLRERIADLEGKVEFLTELLGHVIAAKATPTPKRKRKRNG